MFALVMLAHDGQQHILNYNPHTSSLTWADGTPVSMEHLNLAYREQQWADAHRTSPSNAPGKVAQARQVKIQLGMKCNFSCTYCNQASQPHEQHGNPKDVPDFMARLESALDLGDGTGVRFEFWGGEPFVYWKTLKPLAEAVRERWPAATFNMISNGSLIDAEKVDWLDRMGFAIGISHDGPAHAVNRGPDPFDDPESAAGLKLLFDRLAPQGRMSFNCVLTTNNMSLDAVRKFVAARLGVDPMLVPIQTEEFLGAYDDGGASLSVANDDDMIRVTHTVFGEAALGQSVLVPIVRKKLTGFTNTIASSKPSRAVGQKCGVDRPDSLSVDLKGNVLTCQNTAAETKHGLGSIDALDKVRFTTGWHWSEREGCSTCPVLHLCGGSCLFLEGDMFAKSCDNSFAYNLGLFAAALYAVTQGMVLQEIRGQRIRKDGVTSVPVIDLSYKAKPAKKVIRLAVE
ncbi:radical SAM protein [Ralstonia pickettii]|uniref:radical SAM/SPASM domain-containing protein n=1 Tax=Ralstonia pickettii TaxID=329 RepID=UPI002714D860|nr:radical SAM protein [Ralstonia pickettii]WKZ86358.1 radical SAM protein [Ralstonia pickettii]